MGRLSCRCGLIFCLDQSSIRHCLLHYGCHLPMRAWLWLRCWVESTGPVFDWIVLPPVLGVVACQRVSPSFHLRSLPPLYSGRLDQLRSSCPVRSSRLGSNSASARRLDSGSDFIESAWAAGLSALFCWLHLSPKKSSCTVFFYALTVARLYSSCALAIAIGSFLTSSGPVLVLRCPVLFIGSNYRDWVHRMCLHMRGLWLWEFLMSEPLPALSPGSCSAYDFREDYNCWEGEASYRLWWSSGFVWVSVPRP
jgi:hypothetical protein